MNSNLDKLINKIIIKALEKKLIELQNKVKNASSEEEKLKYEIMIEFIKVELNRIKGGE